MAELISAGPFATVGEQQAAAELKKLPDKWVVICNKTLPTSDGRSYEIDFIVIGDRWVFLIDEKSWSKKITGTDQNWTHGSRSMNSPLNKADYVSKILADYIRLKVGGLRGYFVRGSVLLSLAKKQPPIRDPRAKDSVFLLANICQRLSVIDGQGGNPSVEQLRDQIKGALVDLSDRPEISNEIGAYTVEEVLATRPGCKILQATIEGVEVWTLMLYDLGRDPTEANELKRFYMREFTALRSLRETELVPEVQNPFPWSDNEFLVLPISTVSGKSLRTYRHPKTLDDFVDELLLAEASFRGLNEIHNKQILHRAIGPDSVFVVTAGQNPKITFTNFFAARTSETSIATSLDALAGEDPYAAPELAGGYGFATTKTDILSLTLVFIERLSGMSVSDLRPAPDRKVVLPDLKSIWSELPDEVIDEPHEIFRRIFIPAVESSTLSAGEIADLIGDLARRLRVDVNIDAGRLLDDRYKVHRLLGQGNMARTYLVTDNELNMLFAVKQFFQPSVVHEQAKAEFGALMPVKHPNLPIVHEVYSPQQDIHVKMGYVPGPTLKQVEAEFPWPLERWWTFAQGLMSAVEELEKHNLLHRDIKPSNIILHEDDNRPVLIDFGFAVQQGIKTHAAGAPLYLPPEALSSSQPPPSSDRYALSVVLFKVLTGMIPFEINGERILITPEQITNEKARKVAEVLLRAVSNDPTERHSNVEELRVALQAALLVVDEPPETEDLEELINPWVDSIRGLYRNSDIGNADNRGLDTDFAQQTYISTALDDRLMPALFEKLPKVIFLSGNPGDGKTAFLEQVKVELERRQATSIEQNESGWEYRHNIHTFRSCYDASEAHEGHSADEQLTAKLHGLEGDDSPDIPLTVLIAINDGRLADYFARNQDRFVWLSEQIEVARDPATGILSDVWLVDLKQRSFVNFPGSATPSVFRRVLKRLVEPEEWKICDGCAAKVVCPIRSNAAALREPIVSERLEYLLLFNHLRRQRHITMRDLRSALAYLITGNISCEEVHSARRGVEVSPSLVDRFYWQSTFAPVESGDELLSDLVVLDPARFPHPHLDRFLHFQRLDSATKSRSQLFYNQVDLSPRRFANERAWIAATKRRLYFEAVDHSIIQSVEQSSIEQFSWKSLLPFKYVELFFGLLAGEGDFTEVHKRLALGILRSDGVLGPATSGKLSIVVTASDQQQLTVLKQFPTEEFTLQTVELQSSALIENIPEYLVLEHTTGTPRLEITLDLFELLMQMADGLQPSAPEFRPLLEDLVPFKSTLLLRETRDLVLVESQRRIHHITQRNGKIILSHSQREVS